VIKKDNKRFVRKKDEKSVIYIRFKLQNFTTCNYVGQTGNILRGRPFRLNAYGSAYKGTGKWASAFVIKCPDSRLDVREAYFVLKYRPTLQKITGYFRKAWHLLKKEEMLDIIEKNIFTKETLHPNDWERVQNKINLIKESNDQNYIRSVLIDLDIAHKTKEEKEIEEIRNVAGFANNSIAGEEVNTFLFKPISKLHLTNRLLNSLEAADIKYIGELCSQELRWIKTTPNLGKSSLKLLNDRLTSKNLYIGMELPIKYHDTFKWLRDRQARMYVRN
tara:strand:+ start:193 stop:1020 length:828 start_codon:yes stop_codon:yes gene_type:complete